MVRLLSAHPIRCMAFEPVLTSELAEIRSSLNMIVAGRAGIMGGCLLDFRIRHAPNNVADQFADAAVPGARNESSSCVRRYTSDSPSSHALPVRIPHRYKYGGGLTTHDGADAPLLATPRVVGRAADPDAARAADLKVIPLYYDMPRRSPQYECVWSCRC